MLSFVHQIPSKPGIIKFPHIDFGVSAQSPQTFQSHNSMISSHSYLNPFVDIDSLTLCKMQSTGKLTLNINPNQKNCSLNNKFTTSRPIISNNYSHLKNQDGFLTGRNMEIKVAPGLNHSLQLDKTFEDLNKQNLQKNIFNKKKGQFTTYLQSHLANIDFAGPLNGDQRSFQRKNKTRQQIIQKQIQKLQKTKQKYLTIQPNRSLSPLLQKTKIHRSRLNLNQKVHISYKQKSSIKQKRKDFQLPQINKKQLQESLLQLKQNYKFYKNQNLNKSYLNSSLCSIKTVDLSRSCFFNKIR